MIVDSHCHLNYPGLMEDFSEVLERCQLQKASPQKRRLQGGMDASETPMVPVDAATKVTPV